MLRDNDREPDVDPGEPMPDQQTPRGITVRGVATVETPPDHASVLATVRTRGRTAEEAFAGLAERTAACDEVLDDAAACVRRRETSSLGVQPVVEYDPQTGQSVQRGHTAWRTVRLEVVPGDGVADLLRTLVSRAEAELDGPQWHVDETNPVHDTARRAAAADARRRAEAYAAGLAVAVGSVAWVSEPTTGEVGVPMYARQAMSAGDMAGQGGPAVELAVDRVRVEASVTVSFHLAG